MRGDGAEEVRCEKRWGGGSEENRTELPRRGTKGRGGAVRPLREKNTRVSRRKKSRFFAGFRALFASSAAAQMHLLATHKAPRTKPAPPLIKATLPASRLTCERAT